jgi:dual specificity phosphatase 12
MSTDSGKQAVCRMLVVGANQARCHKVAVLLQHADKRVYASVRIEYIPSVASFGSYTSETGDSVRYLASINYHGPTAADKAPTSLAPFFDTIDDHRSSAVDALHFDGIAGAAIGIGIESEADVGMITRFIGTISSTPVKIGVIKPNAEYAHMAEETEAFRNMTPEQKQEAETKQTIGPAKMALFAYSLAKSLIDEAIESKRPKETLIDAAQSTVQSTDAATDSTPTIRLIDENKPRFSCRKCRTILFGQDDLQDPPHVVARHAFAAGKQISGKSACTSWFLQTTLPWMESTDHEGKAACPTCQTKVGHWNWSGAQCSCGTWVVPSIQIPHSKVDVIVPTRLHSLPAGTITTATTTTNVNK